MITISFSSAFAAIIQIFLMGAIGYILVYRRLLDESALRVLSWLSINITFPLFIFHQIISHFDPHRQAYWWMYPLINISLCLTAALTAWTTLRLFGKRRQHEWIAVSSFHNAGYIPILLVAMLPLGEGAQQLYSCVILSIVGFDLCLWSLGVWLLSSDRQSSIGLKNFINPPLIAMFMAFALVLSGFKPFIPELVLKPVKIMGDSALAMVMITIGGNLALTHFGRINGKKIIGAVFIKLIFLPSLVLLLLRALHVQSPWGLILLIQSCMPTSITLSIFARHFKNAQGDLINQTIFLTHLLCGLTIPVFLGLYAR